MMAKNSMSLDEILDLLDGKSYEIEIRRLEIERTQITDELKKIETEYTETISEAASYDEAKQKSKVQEAKVLKKKWKIKKETKKRNTMDLATVILVGAAQELIDRCGTDITDINVILDDPNIDSDDVTASVWNSIEKYDLDLDVVAKVQNELELDLIDIEVGSGPWHPPIPEDPPVDFDDVDLEVDAVSDSFEDFEYPDLDLDSEGQ